MTTFLIVIFTFCCFFNAFNCDRMLKKYKNGNFENVRLLSFYKYRTEAGGKSRSRITWFYLTIELPLKFIDSTIETTISTTNSKAKKYKDMDYIDVYVVYRPENNIIDQICIKEDMKTPAEKYLSIMIGIVSMVILIVNISVLFA